jgi:hypothetical protein
MDPQDLNNMLLIRSGYLSQLAIDAGNPVGQPQYSLDGESVSRDGWRQGLIDRIEKMNAMIQAEQPYELQSVAI